MFVDLYHKATQMTTVAYFTKEKALEGEKKDQFLKNLFEADKSGQKQTFDIAFRSYPESFLNKILNATK